MAQMWLNALWHPSHEHGHGLFFGILNYFWPKMEYFDSKLKLFIIKNGPKSSKNQVADVHHGGLGRVQEGKNGLEG